MTTMAHLDDTQLLDAANGERDGQLDAAAASHLAGCRTCSDRVSELRSVIESVASVEVPEPSPLFWDHFPARVTRAIDAAPEPTGWWSASRWVWGSAATAAMVMVLMLLPLRREAVAPAPTGPTRMTGTVEAPTTIASSDSEAGSVEILDGDEAWDLVRAVAEGTDLEDVQEGGLTPRAGSLERAALELSDDERAELARLLTQEIHEIQERKAQQSKRSGASTP